MVNERGLHCSVLTDHADRTSDTIPGVSPCSLFKSPLSDLTWSPQTERTTAHHDSCSGKMRRGLWSKHECPVLYISVSTPPTFTKLFSIPPHHHQQSHDDTSQSSYRLDNRLHQSSWLSIKAYSICTDIN